MGDEEEEEDLKGHTITMDLYVSLRDLYVGRELKASAPGGYHAVFLCLC